MNENENTINNNTNNTLTNNAISAAAVSSDNQSSTLQPQVISSNYTSETSQHTTQNSSGPSPNHPYSNHNIYQPNTINSGSPSQNGFQMPNQIYNQQMYSSVGLDMQQNAPLTSNHQHNNCPSYLNSYEQFYPQQQQQNLSQSSNLNAQLSPHIDYINFNNNAMYPQTDYKQDQHTVRYHPHLHNATSIINPQNNPNAMDVNRQTTPMGSTSAQSSLMSQRVVSSTSPSSACNQMPIINGSTSSIGSPHTGTPQCKKCGIMCTSDTQLQEHIANVHCTSICGSSNPPLSQQQVSAQQPNTATVANNAGNLLDLDAQKMLYPTPSAVNNINNMMHHQPLGSMAGDPLHGLHSMQQRAGLSTRNQSQTYEGMPPYLQQQQPPQVSNSSNIKTDYPSLKSDLARTEKSFDSTAPRSQQQMMPLAVSLSPAEFPSSTTDRPQDNGQSSQQFRSTNLEPPSLSSTALSSRPLSGKAAKWKSNEARRPKTYNCKACNKWFSTSGHLKRHYNTTLHKNAVKLSGQPDPATLPISAHHHPAQDPNSKSGSRGAAVAAAAAANNSQVSGAQQQQQPPIPVQRQEPPNSSQNYGGQPQLLGGIATLIPYTVASSSTNGIYQGQLQLQLYQRTHGGGNLRGNTIAATTAATHDGNSRTGPEVARGGRGNNGRFGISHEKANEAGSLGEPGNITTQNLHAFSISGGSQASGSQCGTPPHPIANQSASSIPVGGIPITVVGKSKSQQRTQPHSFTIYCLPRTIPGTATQPNGGGGRLYPTATAPQYNVTSAAITQHAFGYQHHAAAAQQYAAAAAAGCYHSNHPNAHQYGQYAIATPSHAAAAAYGAAATSQYSVAVAAAAGHKQNQYTPHAAAVAHHLRQQNHQQTIVPLTASAGLDTHTAGQHANLSSH